MKHLPNSPDVDMEGPLRTHIVARAEELGIEELAASVERLVAPVGAELNGDEDDI